LASNFNSIVFHSTGHNFLYINAGINLSSLPNNTISDEMVESAMANFRAAINAQFFKM
jgi:hypothetical protein